MSTFYELAASPFIWIVILSAVAVALQTARALRRERMLRRWERRFYARAYRGLFDDDYTLGEGERNPPQGGSAISQPRRTRARRGSRGAR